MRVLVLGAGGQVGRVVVQQAPPHVEVVARARSAADIGDTSAMRQVIDEVAPIAIINCAAITNVDYSELHPDVAWAVNATAPGLLASLAREIGARFLHISTDYVFDGTTSRPYAIDDAVSPVNAYGRSKAAGERAVLDAHDNAAVVRTAWVHSALARTFVRVALDGLRAGSPVRMVDDQISTPTRAAHLADALWHLVARPQVRGILHFTDAGTASRYDVAIAVRDALRERGISVDDGLLTPSPSSAFPTAAPRPLYSVLDKHASWAAIGLTPPHWQEGVMRTVNEVLDA